jgi:hypothetical protein
MISRKVLINTKKGQKKKLVLNEYKNEKKSTSWSAHGPATMKISGINPIKKKNPKAVGPSGSGGSGRKLCQKKQKKKCNLHNKLRKACDSGQVDGTTYSCDLAGS